MPALPTDIFFVNQWHLLNTGQSGGAAGVDLRIFDGDTSVWDEFTGAGVSIGVIDDGIDYNHVDLDDNYDASLEGSADGFHPNTGEEHGTAVAGIIAAENNGVGVVGVAYDATVTSLPAITTGGLDLLEALQLGQNFDIVNNSWGYNVPFLDNPNDPAFAADFAAMEAMLTDGRDGLGTIFVKSAGNGRDVADNANSSGTNTFHGSITVAALDHNGFVSEYSTEGSSILVSAFGGNFTDPGRIWTTDRSDGFGYNDVAADEDYTQGFNGTSAAAPMVSGVVALMLDANEDLGWRDVQTILSYTARHTGTDIGSGISGFEFYEWQWNGADDWNNGALHFSNDYGFGVVDALAAVRLAEYWSLTKTSENLGVTSADAVIGTPIAIPDDDPVGISFTINVTDDIAIENLRLTLQGDHTFVGDLQIELTSPDGTTSVLWLNNEGSAQFPSDFGWVLSSNLFRGEDSAGTWTVVIRDVVGADIGSITGATLDIEGAGGLDAEADTYVFTNEYSDYADPSRNALNDSDGGIDELNASAVTSASQISLVLGALNVVDGVSFTMQGDIEIAVGGDGADAITGNAATNLLIGGRGNDTINGGADVDNMVGAAGNDTFIVDNAFDQVIEAAGGGADTLRTSVSYTLTTGQEIETLTTNAAGVNPLSLTGNEFNNNIQGNTGANIISGGGGVDTMSGFGGADTYTVDNAGDRVNEAAGGGGDTVRTTVSYTLTAGQEIETLTTNAAGVNALSLTGNSFANAIKGNAGANVINGKLGADTLSGFGGADSFVFDTALSGGNIDRIISFVAADDTIQLDQTIFTALVVGNLAPARFKDLSLGGQDATDRILYNKATGALLYDGDGLGGTGPIQFATLDTKPTISNLDFVVVA